MFKAVSRAVIAMGLIAFAPTVAAPNQNGANFIELKTQLDQATAESIEPILAGILDDYCPFSFERAIRQFESSDVFAVLFHPNLVNHLAEDTPERRAVWDEMASALENQYFVVKEIVPDS
jgi:hypothetical protein